MDELDFNLTGGQDSEIRFPEYDHVPYERVFYNTNGVLRGSIADGFYEVAIHTVKRILHGESLEDIEGAAAVYLFRHYLELTIKRIISNLRRLKTDNQNCPEEEQSPVKPTHLLGGFWEEILRDCPRKAGSEWGRWDINEIDKCVREFAKVDPKGERFRYNVEVGYGVLHREKDDLLELCCPRGHKLLVQKVQLELADEVFECKQCCEEAEQKAKGKGGSFDQQNECKFRVRDRLNPLVASWSALLKDMQHTHHVLTARHTYLVETYFENEEWEAEQNSW